MHSFENPGRIALLVSFLFAAGSARAEWITPNSIPNPPPAVGSANGTAIYASNKVVTQYITLGMDFVDSWTAITRLHGVSVWAPAFPSASPSIGLMGIPLVNSPIGAINYYSKWGMLGNLDSLSTRNPITVSWLTVETIGDPKLSVLGRSGHPLPIAPVLQSDPGPHGGEVWKFTGSGISSFYAIGPSTDPQTGQTMPNPAWGIAEVSFAPNSSPEPSSLVLAALGALGLAGRFLRQR